MAKKILLAEDDKFLSRAYKEALEQAEFEVLTAFNGEEALIKMRAEKPDLVLLDLIMPVKNGFEVLGETAIDPVLRDIPIIILSNLSQETDVERGKALGAVDYLVKADFSLQAVVAKIKEHLARKEVSKKQ